MLPGAGALSPPVRERRSVEMDATATLRLTVKRQAIIFYDERARTRGASNEPRALCWSLLGGRLNALIELLNVGRRLGRLK
jgi:hypothetical protein